MNAPVAMGPGCFCNIETGLLILQIKTLFCVSFFFSESQKKQQYSLPSKFMHLHVNTWSISLLNIHVDNIDVQIDHTVFESSNTQLEPDILPKPVLLKLRNSC